MKTKLIAITILMLLAATPLTYARGGSGGGHGFGGGHFGGFSGGHGFHGGGPSYGGGHGFYGGGRGSSHHGGGYYGRRGYGHHGDGCGHHRGHNYYYSYNGGWWPWYYGYYDLGSPYGAYVYGDDNYPYYRYAGHGSYRYRHGSYHTRSYNGSRSHNTARVHHGR